MDKTSSAEYFVILNAPVGFQKYFRANMFTSIIGDKSPTVPELARFLVDIGVGGSVICSVVRLGPGGLLAIRGIGRWSRLPFQNEFRHF